MGKLHDIFQEYKIRPIKSLGQNFLIDGAVLQKIADAGNISSNDIAVEIGAGMGGLTTELAKRAERVLAVEIDTKLFGYLKNLFGNSENVKILNADIMKISLSDEIAALSWDTGDPIKVIANLPYYITTPVLMRMLEKNYKIKIMVLMMQKEVADRILAAPGTKTYGALTVAAGYYCSVRKITDVPPHCFVPQPGVTSSVLRFDVYEKPQVKLLDRDFFFRTVRAAFNQRRKTLLNALSNSENFNNSKEEIRNILSNEGIEENRRGETLSILQFANLSNSLFLNKH
ncbi:MAG: 16S rRNA (adenine(1518)-N(6)/adenine(1519)-N(6))-dimethyltransferase RsmA [Eubacteriales bacterium]|nr:16S rRNA (adenine(1518)-N(6)/adenine(1519)-N(6))-dimethyltransferase RsmA [Eubacteriales bacterium]